MQIKNMPSLKINSMSQEQFEREKAAGNIEDDALYLTPDETAVTVTIDKEKETASHTSAEIYARVKSGGTAVLYDEEQGWVYNLNGCCDGYALFLHKTDDGFNHEYAIYNDRRYDRYEKQYARVEDCPTDDHINSLIDAKLAQIPIAEEASF